MHVTMRCSHNRMTYQELCTTYTLLLIKRKTTTTTLHDLQIELCFYTGWKNDCSSVTSLM